MCLASLLVYHVNFFPSLTGQQKRFQAFETATYFGFPDDFEVNTLQMQLIKAHIH